MGMLLLLSQQWMEVLNVRHEIRTISLDLYSIELSRHWHPTVLPKVSAYGIHSQIYFADFLYSRSQRVALNGILSSPLPVKARVPPRQCSRPYPIPNLHQLSL